MRRRISGVLLLDKPIGPSSNHALQAVKRLYRADKAGHAGTLDPLASGLLPVLLGDATRFSGYLLDAAKAYEADIILGITTRTADAEGEILEQRAVTAGRAEIDAVLTRFLGIGKQIPPMYSALKRDGTPLYVLARRGETVQRAPRSMEISTLVLRSFDGGRLKLGIVCSKGTYVRTLAEDIGAALGCGAHLAGLRRTAIGALRLEDASTLDELESMTEFERDRLLVRADRLLGALPRIDLDEALAGRFCQGQVVAPSGVPGGISRVYGPAGRFLGLGEAAGGGLAPKRLLSDPPVCGQPAENHWKTCE